MNIKKIARGLVYVGAFAWGILGLTSFFGNPINVVELVSFGNSIITNTVYVLVGVAAGVLLTK